MYLFDFKTVLSILLTTSFLFAIGCDKNENTGDPDIHDLPEISEFLTAPSDQFPVDLSEIESGHPYKGLDANTPHTGAHTNFDTTDLKWQGSHSPEDYPKIYAVADGVIQGITEYYAVGSNYRYGFNLIFAKSGSTMLSLSYSAEQMINPGDSSFYKSFIKVQNGQKVKKGDVLGYLYVPYGDNGFGGSLGTHLHFQISTENNGPVKFLAPAIFKNEIVQGFYTASSPAYDGTYGNSDDLIPVACMGYKIRAEENPFGSGAKNCL